jgi:hypothetical protein
MARVGGGEAGGEAGARHERHIHAADRVGTAPMYRTEYRGWRLWYRTEYRKTGQYQYRRTEPRYKTTSAAIPTYDLSYA